MASFKECSMLYIFGPCLRRVTLKFLQCRLGRELRRTGVIVRLGSNAQEAEPWWKPDVTSRLIAPGCFPSKHQWKRWEQSPVPASFSSSSSLSFLSLTGFQRLTLLLDFSFFFLQRGGRGSRMRLCSAKTVPAMTGDSVRPYSHTLVAEPSYFFHLCTQVEMRCNFCGVFTFFLQTPMKCWSSAFMQLEEAIPVCAAAT